MAKAVILGMKGGKGPSGVLVILLGTLALCSAAIFNGFPLVWPDTSAYILAHDVGYRSPFYGYLIHILHWRWSLWPVVMAQSWLMAHLLWLVCRTVYHQMGRIGYLLVICGIGALSSLPWFTGFLMPDLFAPVLGLSIYLLAFHHQQLKKWERPYLIGLVFLSVLVHLSHLPLALGLMALVVLLGWESNRGVLGMAMKRLVPPVVLAAGALVAHTFFIHGEVGLVPSGSPFLAARFLTDGPGLWVLDEECPEVGWRLCQVRQLISDDSDQILWDMDGPFQTLGGLRMISGEARELVGLTLRRYPLEVALNAGKNGGLQLVRFATGHGLESYLDRPHPTEALESGFPHLMPPYAQSRQSQERLRLEIIDPIHQRVILGSLIFSGLLLLVLVVRKSWGRFRFLLFTAGILLLNALIAGALSTPNNRYQSRVIWLIVFVAFAGAWSVVAESVKRRLHARKGASG